MPFSYNLSRISLNVGATSRTIIAITICVYNHKSRYICIYNCSLYLYHVSHPLCNTRLTVKSESQRETETCTFTKYLTYVNTSRFHDKIYYIIIRNCCYMRCTSFSVACSTYIVYRIRCLFVA